MAVKWEVSLLKWGKNWKEIVKVNLVSNPHLIGRSFPYDFTIFSYWIQNREKHSGLINMYPYPRWFWRCVCECVCVWSLRRKTILSSDTFWKASWVREQQLISSAHALMPPVSTDISPILGRSHGCQSEMSAKLLATGWGLVTKLTQWS